MPLTRETLDEARCAHEGPEPCDCTTLFFHGRCHPSAPTWAKYSNGVLTIECSVCEALIAEIAVAS